MLGSCGRRPMMNRSRAITAARTTRVVIQSQADTFNGDLRQARIAVPRGGSPRARRWAAVGGLFRRGIATVAPGTTPAGQYVRADESDAGEYSPPTRPIVAHRSPFVDRAPGDDGHHYPVCRPRRLAS